MSGSVSAENSDEAMLTDFQRNASLPLQDSTPLTDRSHAEALRFHEEVERVYGETREAICSYLLYLGVPASQAQEVAQEVYLRLYQTMRKGQEIENIRAWLFRVAHHQGLKVRSRERSFHVVNADWERFSQPEAESPERQLLHRERMSRVASALESLSPQQRNCLYLRSEGLRYREIAEIMGIGPSTVNEFLRRGIARLAEAVHE